MRNDLLSALKHHFNAQIVKHKMNVEAMLYNPTAMHDHTDLMSALESEIEKISVYHDKLEVVEKYFSA
jgi:hypothetical protein